MAIARCTPEEFEQRWTRVQGFLQEQDLGGLLAYSPPEEHKWGQTGHVSYLSGWDNHDRFFRRGRGRAGAGRAGAAAGRHALYARTDRGGCASAGSAPGRGRRPARRRLGQRGRRRVQHICRSGPGTFAYQRPWRQSPRRGRGGQYVSAFLRGSDAGTGQPSAAI